MKRTVLHYLDSKDFGGAENMVLTVLKGMDQNKWKSVLVYHNSSGIVQFIEEVRSLGITTVCLPEIKSWRDFAGFMRFIRELKKINPSIFHAHLPWVLNCTYGLFSAYLSRVPAIVATQYAYEPIESRKRKILQKLISFVPDRYIAVSLGLAETLNKALYSKNKTIIIHNGINTKSFSKSSSKDLHNELGLNCSTPLILTIARLDKIKGLEYLIRAAPAVPGAIFMIAGDGPERNKLESLASDIGVQDRVVFLGYREDIPELLSACDIFVLPSINDALPLSILEAMAAGKPVVASDIQGIDEEVIHNKTGILVQKENPEALGEAINLLLSNSEHAQELGSAGRIRVNQEFSDERMINRLEALYEEILK